MFVGSSPLAGYIQSSAERTPSANLYILWSWNTTGKHVSYIRCHQVAGVLHKHQCILLHSVTFRWPSTCGVSKVIPDSSALVRCKHCCLVTDSVAWPWKARTATTYTPPPGSSSLPAQPAVFDATPQAGEAVARQTVIAIIRKDLLQRSPSAQGSTAKTFALGLS